MDTDEYSQNMNHIFMEGSLGAFFIVGTFLGCVASDGVHHDVDIEVGRLGRENMESS
jgi:hypothetical protein